MNLGFTREAWDHTLYWQANDRTVLRKINGLIEGCLRHACEGAGKPERLKGDFAGFWSRRIDREHRLVYRVTATSVDIVQCRYHY